MNKQLTRVPYKTDVTDEEPEYVGVWSQAFPDPGLRGSQIVDVDWSERGTVWVTFLTPAIGE